MYIGSTKFTDVRAKLCMCCRMSGHSKILISTSAFVVNLLSNYCPFAVWLDWCIMDTSVAAWMSNPDLPAPRSFADLLQTFGLQTQLEQVCLLLYTSDDVMFTIFQALPCLRRAHNRHPCLLLIKCLSFDMVSIPFQLHP